MQKTLNRGPRLQNRYVFNAVMPRNKHHRFVDFEILRQIFIYIIFLLLFLTNWAVVISVTGRNG